MKNRIIRSFLVFFVLLLSVVRPGFTQQSNALVADFKKISEEVDQRSEAYYHLGESIRTIGHRMTGSENGRKAEQYVYDLLKSYGFEDIAFQEFEMNGWLRESLTLQVKSQHSGTYRTIAAQALAYSPSSVSLDGDLVDMGNGLEADYEANPGKAKGKIVLAALNILPGSPEGTRNVHRTSKVTSAIQHGAKGIILFNSHQGGILLTGTASIDGSILSIPAINIGLEDGMLLKEQIAQDIQSAKIEMKNKTGTMKARNVIARIKGHQFPNEKVVVGGHLDSWDLSPGAVDNGLGSFSVLDMARTIKTLNLQPARTLEFVLFMGEEQGLLGSKAYVRQSLKDGSIDQIRYMMNYDMTNDPKNFTATLQESTAFMQGLAQQVASVVPGFSDQLTLRTGLYSDHQPFMLQGIPIAGAGGGKLTPRASQCYHADCDDFDLVNDQEMRNTIRIGAMLAYGVANAAQIPVQRQTDAQIRALMLENNFKDALINSKDWRWED